MKRFFAFAGLMTAAVISLTNCQTKEIGDDQISAGKTFYISASTNGTKTTNDGMSTLWEASDAINLFYSSGSSYENLGKVTIADGAETSQATFAVEGESPSGSVTWYAIYPYASAIQTPGERTAGYTYVGNRTGLTQASFDDMSNLSGTNCPLYGVATGSADEVVIPMKNLASVIEINLTNSTGSDIVVSYVSVTGSEDIAGSYYIDITGDEPVYTPSGDNYVSSEAKVNLTDGALAKGAKGKVYIPIKPYTHSGTLTVEVACLTADGAPKTATIELNPTGAQAVFSAGKIKKVNVNIDSLDGTDTSSIAEVLAGETGTESSYTVSGALVTLVYGSGFFIEDATGTILVYLGATPTVSQGDRVLVSGATSVYSNMVQFNKPSVSILSSGDNVTLRAESWDGSDFSSAAATPVCAYVSFDTEITSYNSVITRTSTASVEDFEGNVNIYRGTDPEVNYAKGNYTITGYVYGSYNGNVYVYADSAEEIQTPEPPQGDDTTVSLTITEYAQEHNCTISSGSNITKYNVLDLTPAVRMLTNGKSSNGGSIWSQNNGTKEWRLYQSGPDNVTIKVADGCTLKSVKLTYVSQSNGILADVTGASVSSGTAYEVSGTSVTYVVSNSGNATNGQVRITDVEIVYSGSGTLEPEPEEEITTSITIPSSLTVYIGKTESLDAKCNVSGATITYESEDPSIATVSSSGVVTGVAEGNVKIYARVAGVSGQYTDAERYCNVTVSEEPVSTDGTWVATAFAQIPDGAEFVFVSTNVEGASYAMSNDNGTSSAPKAVAVTASGNKLSAAPQSNLVWVMSKTSDGTRFKFGENYLYTTATNNGLRIGANANNLIVLDSETGYFTINDGKDTRYIGVYNSSDWRSYTTDPTNNNIKGQVFIFYVKQ